MDTQFIDSIKQSLAASLNPDKALRQQAEQFLTESQKRPDFCSAMLEVSADTGLDQNLSLAAAVQLGQIIDYHWKFQNPEQAERISVSGFRFIVLNEDDKNYVRTNMVTKMFGCQSKPINKQYIRCIVAICRFDYPEKWPTLLSDISNALSSGNDKGILTGCIALFCLCKKYEYELDEQRDVLFNIMQQVSPTLGQIAETYMQTIDNEVSLTILHQIVKIFYTANQLLLCPFLKENNALNPWIQMFKIILDMPVPAQLDAATEDMEDIAARDKTIQWKIKSACARITFRLFSKYANPKWTTENSEEEAC